jgi:hypothetical protein
MASTATFRPKPPIWIIALLAGVASPSVRAEVRQENLIGCWSAAYRYDSLDDKNGDATGSARLCSREPTAEGCGDDSYLEVTYCFGRDGHAFGSETHCFPAMKNGRRICHGSDGLSGLYRLQGNRMDFFEPAEEGEDIAARDPAWSCVASISGQPKALELADCTHAMKAFFRNCDFGREIEEHKTDKCELAR